MLGPEGIIITGDTKDEGILPQSKHTIIELTLQLPTINSNIW